MRMSRRLRVDAPSAMRTQSLSRRLPVTRRVLSMRPSPARSRVTSCSRDISRENTATVFWDALAAFTATFRPILVLPIPGRPASSSRSDLFRPLIFRSKSEKPVVSPGIVSPPAAVSSPNRSRTDCSTTLMGTMFWALRPRRMA